MSRFSRQARVITARNAGVSGGVRAKRKTEKLVSLDDRLGDALG